MEKLIRETLKSFDHVGFAAREQFAEIQEKNNPCSLLQNYESVISFSKGSNGEMGNENPFNELIEINNVLSLLSSSGYQAKVLGSNDSNVSLVRIAMEAGIGEISPVDSIVSKGIGLTGRLNAIVTDAKLTATPLLSRICINCNKCLNVCPIRDIANEKGDLSKCACGKCVNVCPV